MATACAASIVLSVYVLQIAATSWIATV